METAGGRGTPVSATVATRLRAIREARRLSVRDVSAELAKIGYRLLPSGVSKIENGERRVDVNDLVALAAALNVTPEALLVDLTADEITVAPELSATPYEVFRWLRGEAALPGRPTDWPLWPSRDYSNVRIVADAWDRVASGEEGVERGEFDELPPEERQSYMSVLDRYRRQLRTHALTLKMTGVAIPQAIQDYLEEHPADRKNADG